MTFERATFTAPPEIMCHGKVVYLSRKTARWAIRQHPDRKGLNAYRCPWCSIPTSDTHSGLDRWHVGHRPFSPAPTPNLDSRSVTHPPNTVSGAGAASTALPLIEQKRPAR